MQDAFTAAGDPWLRPVETGCRMKTTQPIMPKNLWTVKVGMAGRPVARGAIGAARLPEIGSQGVVSEILSGKRELNVRQIRALAARFHVEPSGEDAVE